jgi:hypothetical protein
METLKMKGAIMQYTAYNNKELVHMVDNDPNASARERELANRVDELTVELEMVQHLLDKAIEGTPDVYEG